MNTLHSTQPLVSVIIPAYNHESYVQDAIKSIICQSYKNIELHIIDDGSSDGTYDRIEEIADLCRERFVHFTMQRQENCGTCITLNRLLEQATGKYVYPIASDDMAKCGAIKKLVEFLEANEDYCLAVGDSLLIDRDSKICYWDERLKLVYDKNRARWMTFATRLMNDHNIDFSSDMFGSYAKLAKGNHVPNGYLIRKSALDSMENFTTDAPLEDWYMMLQLSKRHKFKFFDIPLFLYRQHGASASTNRERMLLISQQTQNYELKKFILPFDSSNLVADGETFFEKSNPDNRYRATFVKFCQKTQQVLQEQLAQRLEDANRTQEHYEQVLLALQKKVVAGGKIRIGFTVVYPASWGGRGLFEQCVKDNLFEAEIIIIPDTHRGEANMVKTYTDAYAELNKAYPGYVKLFNVGNEYIKLEDKYDIVVMVNPYDDMTMDIYGIGYLRNKNILTIFLDYGYVISNLYLDIFANGFFTSNIWQYMISSKSFFEYYRQHSRLQNCNAILAGYGKMDKLALHGSVDSGRKQILLTSHHTVGTQWEKSKLALSNFLKYHDFFLKLPLLYNNIDFIFRPHPLLFITLVNSGIWTQTQVDAYLKKIDTIPNIRYSCEADYFQIFADVYAMINDCGSFIAEFLFTKKPALFLSKGMEKDAENLNGFALQCIENNYTAINEQEIIDFIDNIVIAENDPLKMQRNKFVEDNLYLHYPNTNKFIISELKSSLKNKAEIHSPR